MADYSQLMSLEKNQQGHAVPPSTPKAPSYQPTNRSIDQSTDQSTSRLTNFSSNKIVEKPKAFYITQRLDKRLDEAVRYFQEQHGIKKVDRSTLVNVMLDNDANWTEEALSQQVERVISQLTSRLTNR
jgi:hypothetical protein